MGLANLFRPAPGADGWQEFWFNNWIDHQDIQQAIQKQLSVNQDIYIINPWLDADAAAILQRHQQFHNDMDGALGINGEDLSSIDFKNERAIEEWVFAHYQDHLAAHQILGI